ncbi:MULTISPECIES: Stp1/IreP family PP2C-type Ser/Thr phosphatase [Clostridia]|uniref:Stp1/IreP family PP2C-type Ser/Thr phosphatase n=1 Tax=Clostridia TaxID=186801 RepID=UPI000EA3E35D|nr:MULTISPECIES: Stp1/IreP family PP2C-type Ser/Thr phosphatase [Clostridia]NBJ68452.1 Stp1/IreP family PP2C-type Ser/Thr phosphatase [Roseburia sp. 1XD42-34]RKI81213.1 Stp1/IreP family PP2C-type Ser/Thr phosphatase [Clostridium sp. 1xD42-85]
MKAHFLTDRGQVRSHNEDSGGVFYNLGGQVLAIIADGMGGHQAGDVASQMATRLLQEKWEQTEQVSSPDVAETWVQAAVLEANTAIFQYAHEHEACYGMGTTIVIAIILDETLTIAHIGDSRAYMITDETMKQITEDHSFVNALIQSGQISKEEATYHPRKNVVLKALGTEETVSCDVRTLSLEQNDLLLLCTDGLTDKMSDEEIYTMVCSDSDLYQAGKKMVQLANERGGEDNISLVLIQHDKPEERAGEPL